MRLILTVDVAPQKVVSLRRTGDYAEIGSMIREVASYINKQHIEVIGPPAYICHEEIPDAVQQAAKAGNADIEVVFPVVGEVVDHGDMTVYELPGGEMARIIHMGPYRELTETYNELFDWLDKNNLHVTGPVREVYINDPETTEEDILVTWIYAPVSPAE